MEGLICWSWIFTVILVHWQLLLFFPLRGCSCPFFDYGCFFLTYVFCHWFRILIRCYTRQRAILGARNQRVEWASIPSLPANPAACRRRIAQLKSDPAIRKALMGLCTILTARYIKQPDDISSNSTTRKTNVESDVSEAVIQPNSNKDTGDNQLDLAIVNLHEELPWDSFDDISVATALNEVMQLRNIAKAISNSRRSSGFRTKVPKLAKKVEKRSRKVPTSLSSMIKDAGSALVPVTRIDPVPLSSRDQGRASMDQTGDAATSKLNLSIHLSKLVDQNLEAP